MLGQQRSSGWGSRPQQGVLPAGRAHIVGCPPCLQRLDLSNCCLSRVPRVLASLPRLTSLTLNENDALGASAAALETLSTLTSLQV